MAQDVFASCAIIVILKVVTYGCFFCYLVITTLRP